jgi:hypothetical protein
MFIPSAARDLVKSFSTAFTSPTARRWLVLMVSAVLTTGRRTVSNLMRTVPILFDGHSSSFHRVFSARRWKPWKLSRTLAKLILDNLVPSGPVYLAGDDTVDGHKGKRVYGKGCHRDAVRSTHSFMAFRWGHKWVVLAILVQFPFASRPWALPVLVALYRSPEWNKKHGRRHRTPPELMRQLLAVLLRWFPERQFVFSGDGGFGTHDLARFAQRRHGRLTVVSRFYPDANLYAPPPQRTRNKKGGRPRKKGKKLPSPRKVVARSKRQRLTVSWYGGGTRRIEVVSGLGYWFKGGQGLVAVRWVFVHDLSGTHRDEYFFSTDTAMTAKQIVETFTGRWSIEVTFEELRAYLGLESTRGWSEKTVLRMAPCLMCLYSVVAILYYRLPQNERRTCRVEWRGKQTTTFSDAMSAVRRWMWKNWVFETGGHTQAFSKLPRDLRKSLLYALAPAA